MNYSRTTLLGHATADGLTTDMDAAEYRTICARPDVMARRFIRATQVRVAPIRSDLAESLSGLLKSTPLQKPGPHESGPESDFFWLDLPPQIIREIVDVLGEIEANQIQSDTPGPLINTTAGLLDLWNSAESSRTSV